MGTKIFVAVLAMTFILFCGLCVGLGSYCFLTHQPMPKVLLFIAGALGFRNLAEGFANWSES